MGTVTPIRPADDDRLHDITPAYDGYTGSPIRLNCRNSVAVARADDPRCPVPWVLVPTSLLNRLAAASGDPSLADEVVALGERRRRAVTDPTESAPFAATTPQREATSAPTASRAAIQRDLA